VIFIDTGAFLARYLKRDQHHGAASTVWKNVAAAGTPCFTSNLVLSESLTLLARRADYHFAAERARHIYSSRYLHILRSDADDEASAIQLFEKFSDQKVSFCDCVSFALMRRFAISDVFAFDLHFAIAGFKTLP
jgi:predicted nucleic acid-binding protein